MKAEDIKKYGKELSVIGRKLNDLGARCALRYENDEQTLEDICKVTEDIFEVSFKAGMEEEAKGGHNAISYLMGQEEERKKWIKEAIKAGILISKPEELAGIITTSLADICLKHRKAGINEVVEWIKAHVDQQEPAPCFLAEEWQAKLKEWGLANE